MINIYGTLGPSCASGEVLRGMYAAGMTGVRINMSHTGLDRSAETLLAVRQAAEENGKRPGILIDMQGPELRIGDCGSPIALAPGSTVSDALIPFPEIVRGYFAPGLRLQLDDGKLLLECAPGGMLKVLRGGTLKPRKSIALEGISPDTPAVTEDDRKNLALAAQLGVDAVMQPFVRGADDLRELRKAMADAGADGLRIMAKIENAAGVRNLESLIPECDEIVIARGDLGNSMPLWKLPAVQKSISAKCRDAGRPFMVVTQMLASMENSPVPTRAEVSDIYNAVLDGAASVMVTGETAAGKYPVEVIRYLTNTALEAERALSGTAEQ